MPIKEKPPTLKNCPSCDSIAKIHEIERKDAGRAGGTDYIVICDDNDCGFSIEDQSKDEAVRKWNRRAHSIPPQLQLPLTTAAPMTLAESRAHVQKFAETGLFCPCCDQFVKVYRRKITSAMSRALIELYKATTNAGKLLKQVTGSDWVHMPTLLASRRLQRSDEAKLVYWDLIEPFTGTREDGSSRNGHYRITPRGVAFVSGSLTVPKYAYVSNSKVIRFSDEKVGIEACLGDRFNYRELMEH